MIEDDGWLPIADAPRNGQHILGKNENSSFGYIDGVEYPEYAVIYWWVGYGKQPAGFYLSINVGNDPPYPATHYKLLPPRKRKGK